MKKLTDGQSSSRNYGLKYATGQYISFVDSDDWLELCALEQMYNKAIDGNYDIVICDMADHYENGMVKKYNCTKFISIYTVTPSACNKIFKKSIIQDLTFLNGKWYEDFNFTTKILLNNPKICVISEVLYHCNVRTISTMNNNNSLKNLDMITVIDDLKQYAYKNNLYDANIFTYLIFDHILITTINRVAMQKNKDSKEVIKTLRMYCKENLGDYKKQTYYNSIPKQRKLIANLNYYGFHNISKFLLLLKSKLK